jgi:hypothetical protein
MMIARNALAFLLLSSAVAKTEQDSKPGVNEVAKEIRGEIADINEALAEIAPKRSNLEEICFRVGSLYLTTRHELEEVAARHKTGSAQAQQLVTELLRDSRSLPSFCDDKEKVKKDPGFEQVKEGDVVDLKRELKNMDRWAKGLLAP